MEKPKRRITKRGLGESGLRPKTRLYETAGPPSGLRNKEEPCSSPAPLPSSDGESDATLSTRRPRSSRSPIRVDEVGDVAVAIAQRVVRHTVPKVIKTPAELAGAPITHRDAFLLSLIDGRLSVEALIDVAGISEAQMKMILERLARLGIITLS